MESHVLPSLASVPSACIDSIALSRRPPSALSFCNHLTPPTLLVTSHHVSRRRHYSLRDWLRPRHSRARSRLRIRTVRQRPTAHPPMPTPSRACDARPRPPSLSPILTVPSSELPEPLLSLPSFSHPRALRRRRDSAALQPKTCIDKTRRYGRLVRCDIPAPRTASSRL